MADLSMATRALETSAECTSIRDRYTTPPQAAERPRKQIAVLKELVARSSKG
jgi:hypothetical protein